MRALYYELTENGYYIKDKRSSFTIYQYEPYIPYRADESDKDYAKHAQAHIDELLKAEAEVEKERITLEGLQKELDITKQAIDELMMMTMEGGMI